MGARSVETFAQQIFGYLPRADQRRWAGTCLKGLLLTDGKKSVRRLAGSVSDSPTVRYSLQQFINGSPWGWQPG
ncbi:transposase [Streptomyces sp. NPDC052721]|uniref:transposase n=1 Tax=Streptomyces sp. NPDC052721 TaxID=3154955 RepID=UPI0034176574